VTTQQSRLRSTEKVRHVADRPRAARSDPGHKLAGRSCRRAEIARSLTPVARIGRARPRFFWPPDLLDALLFFTAGAASVRARWLRPRRARSRVEAVAHREVLQRATPPRSSSSGRSFEARKAGRARHGDGHQASLRSTWLNIRADHRSAQSNRCARSTSSPAAGVKRSSPSARSRETRRSKGAPSTTSCRRRGRDRSHRRSARAADLIGLIDVAR
jgi:hypothetical protein